VRFNGMGSELPVFSMNAELLQELESQVPVSLISLAYARAGFRLAAALSSELVFRLSEVRRLLEGPLHASSMPFPT